MFRRWWIIVVVLLFVAVVGISYRQIQTTMTAQAGLCGTTFPWCNTDGNNNVLPSGEGGPCQTTCCAPTVWGSPSPASTYCPMSPPGWQCVNNTCQAPGGYQPSSQQSSAQAASSTGGCANDSECGDGQLCTTDSCVNGACQNTAITCNAGGECQNNTCNPQSGACEASNKQDGIPCGNNPSCQNTCSGGSCVEPGGCGGGSSPAASSAGSSTSSSPSSSAASSASSGASSRSSGSSRSSTSSRSSASSQSSAAAQQSSAPSCIEEGTGCAGCRSTGCLPNCGPTGCLKSCGPGSFTWRDVNGNACTPCTPEEMTNEPPACPVSGSSNSSRSSASSRSSVSSRSGSARSSLSSRLSQSSASSRSLQSSVSSSRISSQSSAYSSSCFLPNVTYNCYEGAAFCCQGKPTCPICNAGNCTATCPLPSSGSSRSASSSSNSSGHSSAGSQASTVSTAHSGSSRNNSPGSTSSTNSSRISSASSAIGVCRGDECSLGGDEFCAERSNICNPTNNLPCIECLNSAGGSSQGSVQSASSRNTSQISGGSSSHTPAGDTCRGDECSLGGDEFCAEGGLACATIAGLPCIRCVQAASSSTISRSSRSSRSAGSDGGDDGGNNSSDNGDDNPDIFYCGDGIVSGNEECDDGNEAGGDGCTAQCRIEVSLNLCTGTECSEGGNDVCGSLGLTCTGTNDLPCIQCVDTEGLPEDPACNGNACRTGGAEICGEYGMTCKEDSENPCFLCEATMVTSSADSMGVQVSMDTPVMNCSGRECSDGGDSLCNAFGLSCTGGSDLPCISCVNSMQNVVQPSCAEDGCAVGGNDVCGAQNLGCVPRRTGACFVCTNKEQTMLAVASPFICGNGTVDPGEQCDNGSRNSDGMNALCRTNCRLAGCGDGILDTPLEACDDGNMRDGDGCSQICTRERSAPDTAILPGQVIELPFLPGNGSSFSGDTSGNGSTSGVAPVTPLPASTPDTGPAAIAMMAAGAAAGYSWMRKKRGSR